jgi:hypothetical protein
LLPSPIGAGYVLHQLPALLLLTLLLLVVLLVVVVQREELVPAALAAGLSEALLTALGQHKSESTCGALAAALASLARADPQGGVVRHLLGLPGGTRCGCVCLTWG